MEEWKREYWQAAGMADPDQLIGKRLLFEPDWNDHWTKCLQRDGYQVSEVRGTIAAHELQSRGDAHTDYTRLVLVIKVESGASVTDAEITMDAYSISYLSSKKSKEWVFRDGVGEDVVGDREHVAGTLTILDA